MKHSEDMYFRDALGRFVATLPKKSDYIGQSCSLAVKRLLIV